MSRQFDESIQGKFDYHDEWYSPVEEINSLSDLTEALKIRDLLEQCQNEYEPDSGHPCFWMLKQQEDVIHEYLNNIGDFDNRFLVGNINYLARSNDLRIGDVEKILGLSAGYISRTAKENSAKKLSIDAVWKIARLFKVSIKNLIETDLRVPEHSTDMIKQFLTKLYRMTVENKVNWISQGGYGRELNKRYEEMGLVDEQEDCSYYHSNILNSEIKWKLSSDIYEYPLFDGNKNLAIVTVSHPENEEHKIYDFILVWKEGEKNKWARMFCTSQDAFSHTEDYAAELVDTIEQQEFEPSISPEHRNLIANFLREGN